MRRNQFLRSALLAMISILLVAGISNAREVKGKTKSFCRQLAVSATATDGSAVTGPVSVVKRVRLASGKILYIGKYSLEVPEGQKVMMVFKKVMADGTLKPKTVAKFPTDDTGSKQTWHFRVTPPLPGGLPAVNLGMVKVGSPVAAPVVNPLMQVDNDEDGISDFDDNDDDNDGISDNQDEDEDGDGIIDDQGEDEDTDGDGIPDVVDDDDSQAQLLMHNDYKIVFAKDGWVYTVTV